MYCFSFFFLCACCCVGYSWRRLCVSEHLLFFLLIDVRQSGQHHPTEQSRVYICAIFVRELVPNPPFLLLIQVRQPDQHHQHEQPRIYITVHFFVARADAKPSVSTTNAKLKTPRVCITVQFCTGSAALLQMAFALEQARAIFHMFG